MISTAQINKTTFIKQILLGSLLAIFISLLLFTSLPGGTDWRTSFLPAIEAFVAGENPYEADFGVREDGRVLQVFNPPWLFFILAPLAFLSVELSRNIILIISLGVYWWVALKLTNNIYITTLILTSSMTVLALFEGQVEFLVLLAPISPPWLSIWFASIKPQLGFGVITYLLIETWRNHQWEGLIKLCLFPSIVLLVSLWTYGFWPLKALEVTQASTNSSLWRFHWFTALISVGIGLFILRKSLLTPTRQQGLVLALAAAPFFSPYVGWPTWVVIMPAMNKSLATFTWIASWIPTVVLILLFLLN